MAGEKKGAGKSGHEEDGEFDSSKITMKRWGDFESERRLKAPTWTNSGSPYGSQHGLSSYGASTTMDHDRRSYMKHEKTPSNLAYETYDYP